jgi:hypothetical protein
MTDQRMRRSTAVKQVADFVEKADEVHRLPGGVLVDIIDARLAGLWVGGAILENVDRIDSYQVVLVLDAPADEIPWLALHPDGEWYADRLRLTKASAAWFLRSTEHCVHNHELRELVRMWSPDGPDHAVLDRLRHGELAPTDISQPPDDAAMAVQLETELAQSRQHLATMLDSYHDPGWRHAHKGFGGYPEDHLWRAAQAVRELTDAVDTLQQHR